MDLGHLNPAAPAFCPRNFVPSTVPVENSVSVENYCLTYGLGRNEWLQKIAEQLDFYFSEENLPTDGFLFHKVMRKRATAPVAINTLLSFNKLQALGCDASSICDAVVAHSKELTVMKGRKKVRRRENFPRKKTETRTVSVNLKEPGGGFEEVEKLREQFSEAGRVVSISVEGARALVEFYADEEAEKAVELFDNPNNWRSARVRLLAERRAPRKKLVAASADVDAISKSEAIRSSAVEHQSSSLVNASAKIKGVTALSSSSTAVVAPPLAPAEPRILTGQVHSIAPNKKYGFVRPHKNAPGRKGEKRATIFFHCSNVKTKGGIASLKPRDHVRFSLGKNRKTDDDNALDIQLLTSLEVTELKLIDNASRGCGTGAEDSNVMPMQRPKRLQLLKRRAAGARSDGSTGGGVEGHVRMAKGPPEKEAVGFTSHHWRGKRVGRNPSVFLKSEEGCNEHAEGVGMRDDRDAEFALRQEDGA